MPTILEIEGQLVRTIDRRVLNEIPLADMLAHLERRPPIMLPTLPRNRTIGLHWDESQAPKKQFNLAIAMTPAIRLIPIDPPYLVNGIEPRLALPWTIFVFQMTTNHDTPRGQDWAMDAVSFWFSKDEPKGDATDNLIPALLPNVYRNAVICWGNTGVKATQPLMDRIDQTVNEFYQTQFNHGGDIVNNWPYFRPSYKRWAKETIEKGAACYRDWDDWTNPVRTHKTLKEILDITIDVNEPLVLPDAIPNLVTNPTFGRAEQWLAGLNDTQRHRLARAVDNLRTEHPEQFVAPAAPPLLIQDDD